ncbi:MAG: hypothetical protein RIM33_14240 [Alphaproteobacteria bacterium]
MFDTNQLVAHIIRPTLERADLYSKSAENLVLGTALAESRGGTYLKQLGSGPALGIYQMEPATHKDIYENFLSYRGSLRARAEQFLYPADDALTQLKTNLAYATVMCRIHYYRVPKALPDAADIDGLGAYWKDYYNTAEGAGTAEKFAKALRVVLN